jgi:hypothetical protein
MSRLPGRGRKSLKVKSDKLKVSWLLAVGDWQEKIVKLVDVCKRSSGSPATDDFEPSARPGKRAEGVCFESLQRTFLIAASGFNPMRESKRPTVMNRTRAKEVHP